VALYIIAMKVKIKKKKVPTGMDNPELSKLFNSMLDVDSVNITVAYPRYRRMGDLCEQLLKVFTLVANNPFIAQPEFTLQQSELLEFCSRYTERHKELFSIDLSEYEWNLEAIDESLNKYFCQTYSGIKKSDLVNNFVMVCNELAKYRDNFVDLDKLDHRFITAMPGTEWCPFPFTSLNLKHIFTLPTVGDLTTRFFMTVLNKIYTLSFKLYREASAFDIDVDKFVSLMSNSIDDLQKQPKLSRCRRALKKTKESLDLLKDNFGDYYRDFIETKDPTIIMQHFVIDVSKSSANADPAIHREFKTIISYYREMARKKIDNPHLKALFDTVDNSLKEMQQGAENIVGIKDSD